jgi:hypothetical protein
MLSLEQLGYHSQMVASIGYRQVCHWLKSTNPLKSTTLTRGSGILHHRHEPIIHVDLLMAME